MEMIEVQFKGERREYFINRANVQFELGDYLIVEVDRGEDMGRAVQRDVTPDRKKTENRKSDFGEVRRRASQDEINRLESITYREMEALQICHHKVEEHGLNMKLVDAEWQFDGNKVSFYFTAEKRVDFRQLVKDLASIFKTRIELKQIGVRDEARRLGGCGRCGYRLCCTTFLGDFEPVTLRAAKEQRLPLNPAQISGICGRLMCCLMFERDFYKSQSKKFPREGKDYENCRGARERVSGVDIFNETVEVRNAEGVRRKIPLSEFNRSYQECGCRPGSGTFCRPCQPKEEGEEAEENLDRPE
ncbi:stage 0 sporulation protein [bacterium]|nr:stage 0 sporulation protein [bacterium]